MRYTGFVGYHLREAVWLTEISKIERDLSSSLYRGGFLIFQSQFGIQESTDGLSFIEIFK